jgi:hypothetical protein
MRLDIDQLEFIEERLREIVKEVESHFEVEFTVTSLYRIDDSGVHGTLPLRGIDFRCHLPEFGRLVVDYVNSRWQYDPSRPEKKCCIFHTVGKGLHLHFQTHPNTERIA